MIHPIAVSFFLEIAKQQSEDKYQHKYPDWRIGWMARENGVRFIPHGWNTVIGLAVDLQLSSAFSDMDLVEYLTGSPYVDEIGTSKWSLDKEGMLTIPNRPGLGIELDPDALAKYSRGEAFV